MSSVAVTICPPAIARGAMFDKPTFRRAQVLPVHAPRAEDGGRCISFDDFSRMQTQFHGRPRTRITQRPEWTENASATRRVLLCYMESRVCSKSQIKQFRGNERERFVRVIAKLKQRADALRPAVDRLCEEFVTCSDAARRKELTTSITAYDRRIQLAEKCDVFFNVVRDYYVLQMSSVEVAEQNGLSPWGVRAICHRLNRAARSLGYHVAEDTRKRRSKKERPVSGSPNSF